MAHAGRFIPGHDARSNILARGEAQFPSFGHRDVATRQHHARDRTHPLGGSNPKITKITRWVACEASFRCLAREVEIPDRACGERRSRLLHDDRGTEGGGSSTRRAPLGQVVVHERPDTRERWDSRERGAGRCALRLHGWQAPHDESVGWILSVLYDPDAFSGVTTVTQGERDGLTGKGTRGSGRIIGHVLAARPAIDRTFQDCPLAVERTDPHQPRRRGRTPLEGFGDAPCSRRGRSGCHRGK